MTNWQTRSTQKDDGTPLNSPPPPPNMEKDVPNAADKPKKGQKNSGSKKMTDPNKELQIEISETDKASCTPFFCKQTARRGKPFIKQSEPEQKTLAQLKKQTAQIKIEPQETVKVVKEDCHVQIDDSSYGDWLLTQGIQMQSNPPSATPIVISPNPANIHALTNMAPDITPMKTDMQNKVLLTEQSTKDSDKLAKGQEKGEQEAEKHLDKASGSQEVEVQSLTEPNYLLQMQTLIDQGATEEESLERIQKLKEILYIMENKHKPYEPNLNATKTDLTEEEKKTKEELDKTENKLCDNIQKMEQENQKEVNTGNKDMMPKEST